MAAKQIPGEGLSMNLAGMSKSQLYDIMSQMKTLIEQNQQQARDILIQNPLLTKALFQAQIMLGMVQPPQTIPKIPPAAPQHPQPPAQSLQQPTPQAQSHSSSIGFQDQASTAQSQISIRKQPPNPPSMPISSVATPALNLQPQATASHPLQPPQQPKVHQNLQSIPMTLPPSSQLPTQLPVHSASKLPPPQQPQAPAMSSQLQQPMQTSGIPQASLQPPLQPPLPPQQRAPSVSSFHHQYPPQLGSNVGYQHPGGPQHVQQQMYHSAPKPSPSIGSFSQAQPTVTIQQPPQSLYQAGSSHLGSEYSHQAAAPMQVDRGSSWIPGLSEPTQLPGPPPLAPGQTGPGSQPQPPRTAPLSPEMEQALLQQLMSLTPEQINLLPAEQRNQVLQLQQMLRQ
ncbi:bromodomain-containing protein 4 [Punica granatum]|uniref:Bromodomain-containing protein 4 n=1 Tax=Punica granatum TaxID=22663 RepID=A0A218XCT7_PUNGR|nr:bromodomain-containing protein 4 [Punica granatum]OWM83015.1 hypothetical protein CDL15_Pgr005415 [Punica granatum]